MADKNNIPEMRPMFDAIRRIDENNNEYWSSRNLCNAMGYSANWKFQNVINKAIAVANQKGMKIDDHFNQTVDMVKLGSGAYRKVNIFRLSRMACMIIAENADGKKPLVQQARAYFSQPVSTTELIQNSLESNILLYKTSQGETRIEVIFNGDTFWMSQKRMADLFGVDVRTVNYHLGQIYDTGELQKEATIRKIGIVQSEGERDVERTPLFYNLDAIIAVGYRVNSYQATQFRIWATSVLKEFIIKGYALDDERLKQGKHFGKDYFDDLLERIREIRTSERRYYQKITDIYTECSADYDPKSENTKLFFKMVQNMMHQAVTNHTAAEIVYNRASYIPQLLQQTYGETGYSKVEVSRTAPQLCHTLHRGRMRLQDRQRPVRTLKHFNNPQSVCPSKHGTEETLHKQDVQVIGQMKFIAVR